MAKSEELTPENNFCDMCNTRTAIYVAKKRRKGQLVRDQSCASCLRDFYNTYGLARNDFKRLDYKGM